MSKSIKSAASSVAKSATKGGTVRIAVPLSATLELIASEIAGALQETASLSETLGSLTRCAGVEVKKTPDMLDPFIDACKQTCAAVGLTEGSLKVYLSNIRGVLRAMVDGYKPKDGQSLRSMYEAAPKGTGRQSVKTGARPNDGKAVAVDHDAETRDVVVVPTAAPTAAERKHAAMVVLFGHCDDEMLAAMTWAAQHESRFMALVKSQIEFDAKPVGTVKRTTKAQVVQMAA